jgi:transcriptional regulator with XRE-family HTH domain
MIVIIYIIVSMTKLAEVRHKRGISQRDLAIKSRVNFVTIARLESGMNDPRVSTLRALAKALKVKVADLIDEQ